jgi:hypothetical protein
LGYPRRVVAWAVHIVKDKVKRHAPSANRIELNRSEVRRTKPIKSERA